MIRCSAFCLTFDEKRRRRAANVAKAIDRASRGPPVSLELGEAEALTLPLDAKEGPPIVHGWLGAEAGGGEYSMLAEVNGTLSASRDAAGTRPLYVGEGLTWAASDPRFFEGEERQLLLPGSRCDFTSGRVSSAGPERRGFEGSFEDAGRELARLVDSAVEERVKGARKVAVAFSGGLDSSILLICAKRRTRVLACAAFRPGSIDSESAPEAAETLGVELLRRELDPKKVEAELARLELPFGATPMDRSLWCIYSIVSAMASEAGAEQIMLGQLADELFGGYLKYSNVAAREGPGAAAAMMQTDVWECGMKGFIRDEAACSRFLEPRFPFAEREVLEFGLGLPVDFKLREGVRKAVLRQAARELGVPEEIVNAPKKAAQYSSGILKMLG